MASPDQERDRERLIEVLQRELDAARTREQAALERDQAARDHAKDLVRLLEHAQKRVEDVEQQMKALEQRLHHPLQGASGTQSRRPGGGRRPRVDAGEYTLAHPLDMRPRILALLAEHPTGLSRADVERALHVSKHLGDTLVGMARKGLLIRTGPGVYTLPTRKDSDSIKTQ
jgi:hypothetical protein